MGVRRCPSSIRPRDERFLDNPPRDPCSCVPAEPEQLRWSQDEVSSRGLSCRPSRQWNAWLPLTVLPVHGAGCAVATAGARKPLSRRVLTSASSTSDPRTGSATVLPIQPDAASCGIADGNREIVTHFVDPGRDRPHQQWSEPGLQRKRAGRRAAAGGGDHRWRQSAAADLLAAAHRGRVRVKRCCRPDAARSAKRLRSPAIWASECCRRRR